jgi:hypothetical protein
MSVEMRRGTYGRQVRSNPNSDVALRRRSQPTWISAAEFAALIAGWWFANTARRGEDLIAAGLLMLATTDLDGLDKWIQ